MKKPTLINRLLAPLVQKALYDLHPELLDRQPILRINSEDANVSMGYDNNATSYDNYMWLQKAVNVLANNLAPLPMVVVRGSGADTEYLDNHQLYPILRNPNSELSAEDLARQWVIEMMLGGELGIEVVWNKASSKIMEVWPRKAQEYSVKADSVRYLRVASYKVDDGNGEPYSLTPDKFIHFKFYNPLSPFRGLSPVGSIRLSIVNDQLAQAWSRLFFKNHARPDYAVIAPEGITPTEKKEMEASLSQRFGNEGPGKPIILENGITDIKTFSFAPKDMEWLNLREMSRDEVAAIVGVPDEIMGYGRDTYENFTTADRVLWTLTIVPLSRLRDGTLTRFYRKINLLAPDESIRTDTRQVPQLQEDRSAKIEQTVKLFAMGVPVNKASEFLGLGLPTVEGGDIGYLPITLVPVGTPPSKVITPAVTPTETPPPAKAIRKGHTEYASMEHEALWKKLQARLDKPVLELQKVVKREIQRQQNEVGRKLREGKSWGRGLYKAGDNVPAGGSIPTPDDVFDYAAEVQKFIDAFRDPVNSGVQLIGQQTLDDLGISGVFDLTRPNVVAALKHILQVVATKTNETTWTDLTQLFQEAEAAGEGIPKIQERLSQYFGDRKSDYQTERIARTTMNGAGNAGEHEAMHQAQDAGVDIEREWVSALIAGRTRQTHWEAHGQLRNLDEAFDVGGESLMYPGDPNGSPGEIINCLCNVVGIVQE